ncbi:MAG: transglutaminase domain-containing protein [Gemmatimonadetes bacterium]|nr:transglutaminase domain-containing protein [Gemmatimonadota bacterium]
MSRRALGVSILAVWLGAMGWMLARQYRPTASQVIADATLSLPPGATYYALSLGGQQIGYASNLVDTLPDGIRVEDIMTLEVPALGDWHRTEARTEAWLSRQLALRSFSATMRGDIGQFTAKGEVSGDTLLTVDLVSAGSTQRLRTPLKRPIVLPGLLPLQATFGERLRVGSRFSLRMFDPLILEERDVDMEVTGDSTFVVPDSAALDSTRRRWVPARWDTVRAWRVEQNMGGVEMAAWIDEQGRIVLARSPVGFSMERTAFEIAHENFRRRETGRLVLETGDLINQTAIASNVRLEEAPLGTLAVRLEGVTLSGFDLAGGRQTLAGDTLRVRSETEADLRATYRLPSPVPELARYLEPEALIQTTDPRIQAQARQIAGRTRDPRRAAEALNQWVYDNLRKEITVSVPSAVQVLESRQGDCNEHTVLYVALARALGLPTRTAAGLVYLRGRFYYHAWPEVYLNGWVAVDPTFGQFPADASHLRFTIGGLARQVELIRLIGRLKLDVVETGR